MVSRSDKLFQRRKAKSKANLIRRKPSLEERKRALIICEGEKTEPLYLKSFIASLGLTTAEVEICGECGSAPKSVVKFGEEKLKEDSNFEMIFFVFDQDTHSSYDAAIQMIETIKAKSAYRKKDIQAITSVPCFEIWFLLHFEKHTRPYSAGGGKSPCGNLITVLKKKEGFKSYEKGNSDYFDVLSGRLHQAKTNSANTLKQLMNGGEDKHHSNPSTLMHILVENLEQLASAQRR